MVECFKMCRLNWPPFSAVSILDCPGGGNSSKFCTKRPKVIPRIGNARMIPGQLLLPTPNGRYRKSLPLASTLDSSSKNLSGLNSSGFLQFSGLFASHQALTKILLSAGISYPPSLASLRFMWGTKRGIAIRSRRVSLTTAWRYGSLRVSGSVTCTPGPSTVSISCRSFLWTCGWFTNSAMPHSIDHNVVSIAVHENLFSTSKSSQSFKFRKVKIPSVSSDLFSIMLRCSTPFIKFHFRQKEIILWA